MIPYPIGQDII